MIVEKVLPASRIVCLCRLVCRNHRHSCSFHCTSTWAIAHMTVNEATKFFLASTTLFEIRDRGTIGQSPCSRSLTRFSPWNLVPYPTPSPYLLRPYWEKDNPWGPKTATAQ